MHKRIVWALSFFAAAALAAPLLHAQDSMSKPPMYFYVSDWAVPRAQWGEMAKLNGGDRSLDDKLLEEGTLSGYGEFENLIHSEGQPTHGSWMASSNREGILKALQAFMSRGDATAPVLAASKHSDRFMTSTIYNSKPGTYDNAYLTSSMWVLQPGQDDAFTDLIKVRVVPVMEKMLSEGVVIGYGFAHQTYDSDSPGMVEFYTIVADASGFDKVSKAFEGVFGKDPEIGPAMGSLVKEDSHRSILYHISHMKNK